MFHRDDYSDRQKLVNPNNLGEISPRLHFNSFSGVDIQPFFFTMNTLEERVNDLFNIDQLPEEQKREVIEELSNRAIIEPFGDLQTITISSAASAGPVRRLGEREVVEYKIGARTVAGSMIFAVLNRDVFADFMRKSLINMTDGSIQSPNYVDAIPEFNVLIQGGNEFGSSASALIIGVKLTNFGTTFSIDDMYTESTYSYVARHFVPFTDNWKSSLFENAVRGNSSRPVSELPNSEYVVMEINNKMAQISKKVYSWYSQFPEEVKKRIKPLLENIEKRNPADDVVPNDLL
jgi:hypothetical protein